MQSKNPVRKPLIAGKSVDFCNLNVGVLGIGVSGKSAIRLLMSCGSRVFVVNQGPVSSWEHSLPPSTGKGAILLSQEDPQTLSSLLELDLIILSPGIPREHPLLEASLKKGTPVWSEIELGYHFCDLPIASVTGTNGKTTTVTFIGEMLQASGKKPFVGGNIGKAFCDLPFEREKEDYDSVVLELSSFQLESIERFTSNVSALLNVFPNHGERYTSFHDYGLSKLNILKGGTSDDTFYCMENLSSPFLDVVNSASTKVHFLPYLEVLKKENLLKEFELDISSFKLPGIHNLQNLLFASHIAFKMGADKEGLQKAIDQFLGVDFRLQYVPSQVKLTCFNDAKSTNWDATLTALKALVGEDDSSLYLILGGAKRGRGDAVPRELLDFKKSIQSIFLIGETTDAMSLELQALGLPFEKCFTLESVKNLVSSFGGEKKGQLLFSPAFPSFDQYENYKVRGNHFRELFGLSEKANFSLSEG